MTGTENRTAGIPGDDPAAALDPALDPPARGRRRELMTVHRTAFGVTLKRWILAGWPTRLPRPDDYAEGERQLCAFVEARWLGHVPAALVTHIVRRVLTRFQQPDPSRRGGAPPTAADIFEGLDNEVLDYRTTSVIDLTPSLWASEERDEEFLGRVFGPDIRPDAVVIALRHLRTVRNVLVYRAASVYLALAWRRRSPLPTFAEVASELANEEALQDVTEAEVHAAVLRFCIHLGRSAASAETRRQ
jgi:hypothetical protein